MTNVINDASLHGLNRIEISYIADSPEAVEEIFSGGFIDHAKTDLLTLE